MSLEKTYRTTDLARIAQCGVQKVRNWESLGFLPPAKRGANGYRYYTQQHIEAFHVSHQLGFTWVTTMEIMGAVHRNDLPAALAMIDAQQAQLHQQREHINATLIALRAASTALPTRRLTDRREPITIGKAAKEAGVRVSSVRFWEEQGLLSPGREKTSRYRCFDAEQLRQLHVVAMLRKADYSFDAIRTVLDELTSGNAEQVIVAAEQRLTDLTRISLQRLGGLSLLWKHLQAYYDIDNLPAHPGRTQRFSQ
jgi:DNA-binding transcriptional MerR regulator